MIVLAVDPGPEQSDLTPKKKRAKSTSPTQRTLAKCRELAWPVQVVERWNPHARVRVDLFGVIDLVVITPVGILGIQACAGDSHAARRDKILAEPRMKLWLAAGGLLELWSWRKGGARGARKLWTLRIESFAASDYVDRDAA